MVHPSISFLCFLMIYRFISIHKIQRNLDSRKYTIFTFVHPVIYFNSVSIYPLSTSLPRHSDHSSLLFQFRHFPAVLHSERLCGFRGGRLQFLGLQILSMYFMVEHYCIFSGTTIEKDVRPFLLKRVFFDLFACFSTPFNNIIEECL